MADQPLTPIPPHAATLPIAGQPTPERADAARNRQKVLDAVARMIATKGVKDLSLDEVAREAGVGVGTVYRRFGDRAGLVFALLNEHEREFQASFMSGPPPLGPGAPAAERIRAFLHAVVDWVAMRHDLLLLAESASPTGRYTSGPYNIYRAHLIALLADARPDADAHYLADALLAPLSATLITFQLRERGFTYEAIKAGLDDLLCWKPGVRP